MDRTATAWLSIVGLGADGIDSLSASARAAIESAELVVGSQRQLALVRELAKGETMLWPSPMVDGIARVLAQRGQRTCILGSGDPFHFGIGATLARSLRRGDLICYPSPSSMSLAASRLGWPLQDTEIVSLHGRDLAAVIRFLQPGRRILALSWDRNTPQQLAQLLTGRGFGESQLHVLELLGSAHEQTRACLASDFALSEIADLNLVAIEVRAARGALVIPSRGSLPDSAFEHDGQLTKQDVRALTLSALAPFAGALLWDVGAGAGSVAIEWCLAHPSCRAIAIERSAQRCARIRRNAQALGTPTLEVVEASAPAALTDLAQPDAIFVGGGGGEPAIFEACFRALKPGGRLVMNAVALETEALLFALYREHGGQLRRFSVESAEPLGKMTGFRAAMPVTQWRLDKP